MNHGQFTSGPFSLSRGVRQGDPLSPYLFILALEILAINIRDDNNIHGIRIGKKIVKLTLFADNTTCLRAQSLTVPRAQLNYGSFSHLKLRSVAEAQSANPSI